MADKKRTIQGGYEVIHAVELGGSELILAEKKGDPDAPYMVSDCVWNRDLCYESHHNAMGSTDFLEIMKLFAHRLSERVIAVENEREIRGIPFQTLTADDVHPVGRADLEGCIVVIKPEKLAAEYRSIDYQLALCTGGFGSKPDSNGRTVFCKNLITGKTDKYIRSDLAGTVPVERLPDWARVNLETLRPSAVKESEAVAAAKPLDKEHFWQMIDTARKISGGWQDMHGPLVEALSRLEEPDIIRFKQIYNEYQDLAYKEKIWAAAAVINDGCSDDGFIDFRGWLIAQGKEAYLNTLANPDSLADLDAVKVNAHKIFDRGVYFEAMNYAANDAYKNKLGSDADIYDVINTPLLSDREFADITGEIIYAADIDTKWGGFRTPIDEVHAAQEKLVPKLVGLFRGENIHNNNRAAPDAKDSVLEKIKQAQQGNQQPKPPKPKNKKQDKNGPEL